MKSALYKFTQSCNYKTCFAVNEKHILKFVSELILKGSFRAKCQIIELSDYGAVGLQSCRTMELSDYRAVGLQSRKTIELSNYRAVRLQSQQTIFLRFWTIKLSGYGYGDVGLQSCQIIELMDYRYAPMIIYIITLIRRRKQPLSSF